MKQIIRSTKFNITLDTAFEKVITACAAIPREGQDGTWITEEMQEAYINLHELGYAHSIEVWMEENLVGGLYGVAVNQVFCGESMFSKVSNASKAALIWLSKNCNFNLIDCQIYSEHLEKLGAELISREEYMRILKVK
jgi:leucyl/phenylalanyl-tRNA--protein transferase